VTLGPVLAVPLPRCRVSCLNISEIEGPEVRTSWSWSRPEAKSGGVDWLAESVELGGRLVAGKGVGISGSQSRFGWLIAEGHSPYQNEIENYKPNTQRGLLSWNVDLG
jgi:hypothetical protein